MNEQPKRLDENIDSVLEVHKRERDQRTPAQRRVEAVSRIIGRPVFLVALVLFVALWILLNEMLPRWGVRAFDPYPYGLLDGALTLGALLTTAVVLIAQRSLARLEQQHMHIALQINLLTEQKVSKIIELLEELRRDLPMAKDRFDPQASSLKKGTDPVQVLAAIEEGGLLAEDKPDRK
ncbi:MAG TPA: DUF1003 domain-containing protein [Steroidobacteraceae bacterium]|nr:DUF1003 domain-containing protein [Steroidobacteraceae bacterium]